MMKKLNGLLGVAALAVAGWTMSDWRAELPPLTADAWADMKLKTMSLDQKIAQSFMVAAYPGKGEAHMDHVKQLIQKNEIGGVIWFPTNRENYEKYRYSLQEVTKVPLFYALDAEWGLNMRMSGETRYPYHYTLGAADQPELTKKIGQYIAEDVALAGFHFNFGPVADVNSNPDNPVIGFRSFGDRPDDVGKQVKAMVQGIQSTGLYATVKHFPGHGDTHIDSHHDLPTIERSVDEFRKVDWLPFKSAIQAGVKSVMVGHINVPNLDPSGTPSSLSSVVIQKYLREELKFEGLVISDALNMDAVSKKYAKHEVAVKAYEAGNDILVYSEDVEGAIDAIKKRIRQGKITEKQVDETCKRILVAKHELIGKTEVIDAKTTDGERSLAINQVFENATTALRNSKDALPFTNLEKGIEVISIGGNSDGFVQQLKEYGVVKNIHLANNALAQFKRTEGVIANQIVVSLHATSLKPADNYSLPKSLVSLANQLPADVPKTLVVFGNPLGLKKMEGVELFDAVIIAYENSAAVQNRVAQQLAGAIDVKGKLPYQISESWTTETGTVMKSNGRIKFTQPEELGIDPEKLLEIDRIVNNGIQVKAYPGAQIVAIKDGKLFFRKSYGSHAYDEQAVIDTNLYDLASITKVAASTVATMWTDGMGKIDLDKTLGYYLPEKVEGTPYANLTLREILAHRAGLKAWIPFYKRTQDANNMLNSYYYSKQAFGDMNTLVAPGIYIKDSYADSMKLQIVKSTLGAKKYLYSDLGYYFIKEILEKQNERKLEVLLENEIYAKMGLYHTGFNPYLKWNVKGIAPTEDDKIYRKQVIRGYVHDPGAAMIGGVGGHAGLFSNATELATLFQMILNGGEYAGVRYLDKKVVNAYTKTQYAGNRRGAGFDKPVLGTGGGTCHETSSQQSFGHSGFTGTLVWSDPANGLTYAFLSNRVYPDAENKKLITMGQRTEVQRVLNEAIKQSKK